MTNDPEVLNRLLDYHDHISAPPVSVADDLHRGRRRVRRNRSMVAGGVAIALASVVAVVSLVGGDRSADDPQPVRRPGLTTPLVMPESPLDVRELGFHVEPVLDAVPNQDWNLARDHQAITTEWAGNPIFVRVYYPASGPPDMHLNVGPGQVQQVRVHGMPATYVEQFGKATADGQIDFGAGACGTPPTGCDFWQSELVWEFAPGSWASVYGTAGESPPPQAEVRPAFVEIAEAVRSGDGATTRVPFRVGSGPSPLPDVTEAGVGLKYVDYTSGATGWSVSFWGEPTLSFSNSDVCSTVPEHPKETVEPFTYQGHRGCLHLWDGELSGVTLRVDGVERANTNLFGDGDVKDAAHVKQWLVDLTVAPLDDPSTWFDLESALGD